MLAITGGELFGFAMPSPAGVRSVIASLWRVDDAASRYLVAKTSEGIATDFFEQAKRAAEGIPGAEFVSNEGTDHLGMDTASADPALPAILRTLRLPS